MIWAWSGGLKRSGLECDNTNLSTHCGALPLLQERCSFRYFRVSPGRQAETFMRAELKEIMRVLSS